jgi:hypothetical protein
MSFRGGWRKNEPKKNIQTAAHPRMDRPAPAKRPKSFYPAKGLENRRRDFFVLSRPRFGGLYHNSFVDRAGLHLPVMVFFQEAHESSR